MKQLALIILLISLWACSFRSPYPDFSKGNEGIYYRLESIGESEEKAQYSDYITADIQYLTMDDSLFFSGRRKLQLAQSGAKGSIEACFQMLAENESATFIISAEEFYTKTLSTQLPSFLMPGCMMKIHLKIIEIQKAEEYENEKEAFLNWINDFGEYEKVVLQQYLREEKLDVQPTGTGLYHLKLRDGNGKKIEKGDTISVNYEGRFLNGKFFDSTVRRKQPFQFVYGTEWQVVKGLEEAIGMMSEGEKSLFILPSDLAFGTEGSSTGIIPPFTSLIFEVEIIKIN
jgi:FKBP-type peptidyl-prolyl cis-trans isomerase FkpA